MAITTLMYHPQVYIMAIIAMKTMQMEGLIQVNSIHLNIKIINYTKSMSPKLKSTLSIDRSLLNRAICDNFDLKGLNFDVKIKLLIDFNIKKLKFDKF